MNKQRAKTFLLISFIYGCFLSAGTTGKLTGTIKSKVDDGPLIGANIIIENTDLGTSTDLNGDYVILNIVPGKYNVTIRMIGYEVKKYENIRTFGTKIIILGETSETWWGSRRSTLIIQS